MGKEEARRGLEYMKIQLKTGCNRFNFSSTYRKMQIAFKLLLTWLKFGITAQNKFVTILFMI